MANLSQIVKVNIALQTSTIPRESFGIPLVASPVTAFSERYRSYASYDAAVDDGLDAMTLAALRAVFSQEPKPSVAMVGRLNAGVVHASVSGVVLTGKTYTIRINDVDFSYTAVANDTALEVHTGLAESIAADAVVSASLTMAPTTLSLDITPLNPAAPFVIKPVLNLSVSAESNPDDIQAGLSAIADASTAWYGLGLAERSDDMILSAAEWVETQRKLFFACSDTAAIWSSATTDVASTLQKNSFFRTALVAHKAAATEYPEMAWMGRCFTIAPGGETWALKRLSGVTPSVFSSTEQGYIKSKFANAYEEYATGYSLMMDGKVSSGEWIDVIRFRDWLDDAIQKAVANRLISRSKVPYTNQGIATLVNQMRGALDEGQRVGGIAPDEEGADGRVVKGYEVSYPNAADVPPEIKATRVVYLGFRARLAGAIHVVEIDGTLAYTLE